MEALRTHEQLWELSDSYSGASGAGHRVAAEAKGRDSPARGPQGTPLCFQGTRSSPEPSSSFPMAELSGSLTPGILMPEIVMANR